MRLRIAFDLDETLGTAVTDSSSLIGFNVRRGCTGLLASLQKKHDLILWTVSSRRYLDKVLSFGLGEFFQETRSWDEIKGVWKDVRRIHADYLIDDDAYHKEMAEKEGLAERYIIVPA